MDVELLVDLILYVYKVAQMGIIYVEATILRELRNNGLITQKEAEKILSRVAKQTGATLIISV